MKYIQSVGQFTAFWLFLLKLDQHYPDVHQSIKNKWLRNLIKILVILKNSIALATAVERKARL